MIRRFLLKIIVSGLALWVADHFLTGFGVSGGLWGYATAGFALGALNTFVRPLLKILTFPLILITFGLFSALINALMLWLAADLTGLVTIAGIGSLLAATIIVSLVQGIITHD
jgi:putative membrane protein